jgi:uncharacterized protein YndB with AHSA1/START domain
MPVTSVIKDPEALTFTVVADFNAPVRRLWDAYFDPRQIERFWSPPSYPTVFTRHDGFVGGRSEWEMTGSDGNTVRLSWVWAAVDEYKSFEAVDGDGPPTVGPARMVFTFDETAAGSRVSTTTYFNSIEDLEQALEMDMDEGMSEAMGQMDAVLADLAAFAAGAGTVTQVLSDTQVRISRIIRGRLESVWRAHQEPTLVRQWLLGPDGWAMPVCEIAAEVGQPYRYEWERLDGAGRFGFTGTLLESLPPHRSVTTEAMIGVDGPSTTNELTFTAVEDGTLLSLLVTYPDVTVRDAVLATGMTDGMEASYVRLESLVNA